MSTHEQSDEKLLFPGFGTRERLEKDQFPEMHLVLEPMRAESATRDVLGEKHETREIRFIDDDAMPDFSADNQRPITPEGSRAVTNGVAKPAMALAYLGTIGGAAYLFWVKLFALGKSIVDIGAAVGTLATTFKWAAFSAQFGVAWKALGVALGGLGWGFAITAGGLYAVYYFRKPLWRYFFGEGKKKKKNRRAH